MPGVRTAVTLNDQMTAGFLRLANAIARSCKGFESLQKISSKAVDTENLKNAAKAADSIKEKTQDAGSAMKTTARTAAEVKSELGKAAGEADNLGDKLNQTQPAAEGLLSKIKGIATTLGGLYAAKKGLDFLRSSFEAFNAQQHGEIQLATSLGNMGADAGAFNQIKAKAQSIQKAGFYGDESMIAGAAEFATYMKDADAIGLMMDTLADYAAGMSGGGEVSMEEMVNYATNLGKITTGAFDAMTKKGFEFTEAQKAVIDGTATAAQYVEVLGERYTEMSDDMRAAATINQVIADSWKGLYAAMANTPEAKVIALKNAWGDFKEMIGAQVAPAVGDLAELGMGFVDFLTQNLPIIQPLIVGITGAVIGLAVAKGIYAAATWVATGAAQAFFAALLANPFTWIAVGIGVVIMLLYRWIQSVGGLSIAWEICKAAVTRAWEQMKLGFMRAAYGIMDYAAQMQASVLTTVQNMVNGVINLINMLISALNKLPGVSIQAISQVSFGAVAQAKATAMKEAHDATITAADKESYQNLWKNAQKIKHMQAQAGAETSLLGGAGLDSLAGTVDEIAANTGPGGGGGSPAGQTAGNTGKMADAMDVMEDILEYMVDIAERETVNRFTTADIYIDQTNNNSIASGMDLDGIMEQWNDDFTEILQVAAEGVHV